MRRIERLTIEQMRLGDARQCLDLSIAAHTYLGNHHDIAWHRRLKSHLVDANTIPHDQLDAIRSEILRDDQVPPRSPLPEVLTAARGHVHDQPGSPRADLAIDLLPKLALEELLKMSTRPSASEAQGATLLCVHQSLHYRLSDPSLSLPAEELVLTDLLDVEIAELIPSLRLAGPRVTSFWASNTVRVQTNNAALRFIVHGLLCNAVLSAQIGGAVETQFSIINDHAIVRVLDSGPGWGPESGPAEFRRSRKDYSQAGMFNTSRDLRMFLVHMVAAKLRVGLQAHSPGLGSGTTYTLEIPLADS